MCYVAIPPKHLCTHYKHALVLLKNDRNKNYFYIAVKKVRVCDAAVPHGHGQFVAVRIQVPLPDLSLRILPFSLHDIIMNKLILNSIQ